MSNMYNREIEGKFLTKKRIISFAFFTLVLAISMLLTYLLVFKSISLDKVAQTITNQIKNPYFVLILLIVLFKPMIHVVCIKIYLPPSSNSFLKTFWQFFILGIQTSFIQLITPFATGSQPYCIYYLNKRGYKVREIAPIVIFIDLLHQIIIFLFPLCVGLPFAWGSFSNPLTSQQTSFIIFVSLGMTLDLLILLFLLFSGTSTWFQINTTRFVRWFAIKVLRKKNAEFKDYSQAQIDFKNNFIKCFKKWKQTIIAFILLTFSYLSSSFIFLLILITMFEQSGYHLKNFMKVIGLFSIAISANALIPLPGGVGSQEWLISVSAKSIFDVFGQESEKTIQSSIFIWRFWNSIVTAVFGFFVFAVDLYLLINNNKKWAIKEY